VAIGVASPDTPPGAGLSLSRDDLMLQQVEQQLPACSDAPATVEPLPAGIRRLHVYLIKPSKYDDEGYVIRYLRGVLPSNTLSTLYSLTEDQHLSGALGDGLEVRTTVIDETVQRVPVRRIIRRAARRRDTRTVIALAGVQSNQFPRAADLALQFRDGGLPVMLGGFHVSGLLALIPKIPDDIRLLMDRGVTIVKGEVEDKWGVLLSDALHGRLQPMYDYLQEKPDLYAKPIPAVHDSYMKRFAFPGFGTIDAGRGCPFDCSFCTIINVQGKVMRHRSEELIEQRVRDDYHAKGINFYFFTDDNFARNKNWEAIFDKLIRLRQDEGLNLGFIMQVDVLSYKIPGFIARAREAGCCSVFIGMESINQKNLEAAGKTQNDVDDFKNLIAAWHNAGIITHVGYILGFPHDTAESIRDDIRRLREEIRPDLASFFILTPIPGSMDHLRCVQRGDEIDSDYNRYDSFHETTHHPNFRPGELQQAYQDAWKTFYGTANMKNVLLRSHGKTYWDIFKNIVWYKSAILEGQHPMISGFFRLKDRTSRRPGYAVEGRFAHFRRRAKETVQLLRSWWALLLELEEIWLQTHVRSMERIAYVKDLQHRAADAVLQIKGMGGKEMKQRLLDLLHQFRGDDAWEFRRHLDGILQRLKDFDTRQALQSATDQIRALQRQIETHLKSAAGPAAAADQAVSGTAVGAPADSAMAGAISPDPGAMAHGLSAVTPGSAPRRPRFNLLSIQRVSSREPLRRFWKRTRIHLRRGRWFRINPFLVVVNLVRDTRLTLAFCYGIVAAKHRYTNLEA
jgi:radical SAM superfamily enzyme YgiQ (UPF0313 family)